MTIPRGSLRVKIKTVLKAILWADFFSRKSYSQEGEDLVVDRLLMGRKNGFYVDVGAHHPYRFSNTYFFYRKGWRGIAIDPLPGLKKLFRFRRPRDIFVGMGVSLAPSKLKYFLFNEPALNTFDADLALNRSKDKSYRLIRKEDIATDSLASILKSVSCPNQIDLLSVDVEGFDLEVLQSNDWNNFIPEIIIVECLKSDLSCLTKDPIYLYLVDRNYGMIAKTGHSVIFKRNDV